MVLGASFCYLPRRPAAGIGCRNCRLCFMAAVAVAAAFSSAWSCRVVVISCGGGGGFPGRLPAHVVSSCSLLSVVASCLTFLAAVAVSAAFSSASSWLWWWWWWFLVVVVVVGGSRRTAVPPATGRVALERTDGRVAAAAVWAAAFSAVQSPVV